MSKNMPQTSRPLSKDLEISRVMDRSWLIQELLALKPYCLGGTKLFSVKNSYMLLYKFLSNVFPATVSKDIGP